MKTEVTINGVEYNLDLEKAKEFGVLEEKDTRCKSWEEFCEKYKKKQGFCYDGVNMNVLTVDNPYMSNEQLTEDEAIAVKAFSKLLKLRRDWVGDFSPSRMMREQPYKIFTFYAITYNSKDDTFGISKYHTESRAFMFLTYEECSDFKKCFKDLFEQCKYLI